MGVEKPGKVLQPSTGIAKPWLNIAVIFVFDQLCLRVSKSSEVDPVEKDYLVHSLMLLRSGEVNLVDKVFLLHSSMLLRHLALTRDSLPLTITHSARSIQREQSRVEQPRGGGLGIDGGL